MDDPDAAAGIALSPTCAISKATRYAFSRVRACVDRFAVGFEILDVENFEEGTLPKRLFLVTARNATSAPQ